tara:strand:+ start:425 stop:1108 length:684 start_codon:yes stop_codon:yes gene_type:complete
MNTYFLILVILLLSFLVLRKTKENFQENEKSLLFIHIPKTGGTYVEEVFNKHNYKIGRFDNNKHLEEKNKCNFWHTPVKYNKNINFKDYRVFTVVRNPYDRIISEYNWGSFGEYYKKLNVSKNTEINQFISKLNTNEKIYDGDCHLLPQSEYLTDYYGNKVENIIHQENLDKELEKFINKYKLNVKLSKQKNNIKQKNYTQNDLNTESKNIIKNYYKEDFELLGYKV